MKLAGRPDGPVVIPREVLSAAAGRAVELVWENELHGLTFRCTGDADVIFVKWAPVGSGLRLADEAARLEWAAPWVTVPAVLDVGASEDGDWLVTAALPAVSAVDEQWKADPATAVAAIGQGLRALHDSLPVPGCPFNWSVAARIAKARQGNDAGLVDPTTWNQEHQHLSVEAAMAIASEPPSVDQLVVCHGDACAPNTLIDEHGRCAGHVDLGALGIADRWADLAIATWSTKWNYGPGWEARLLAAYGVAEDADRTMYYRLIWDLT